MTKAEKNIIKKDIKHIIREFDETRKVMGYVHDGEGTRYEVGELYLQMRDYEGLLNYYSYFYEHFPDDIGFPELQICWIAAGIKEDKPSIVNKHLIELEDMNTYIIPKLLGKQIKRIEKWEGMNISTEEYADYILDYLRDDIEEEITEALTKITNEKDYVNFKAKLIENYSKLNNLQPGQTRTKIIADNNALLKKWEKALNN